MHDRAPRLLAALLGCAAFLTFWAAPAAAEDFPPAPPLPALDPLAAPADDAPPPAEAPEAPDAPAPADAAPDPVDAPADAAVILEDVTAQPEAAPTTRMTRGKPARWYVGVEAGVGLYDDPDGIMGLPVAGAPPSYSWSPISHDPGFAARLTVGHYWKQCQRLELRGSYQGWSADSSQTGRFGFSNVPGGAVIPSPTSMATLENEAHLWSLEFNWWKTIPSSQRSRFSWGLGARVISLTDKAIAKDWVGLAPDAYLEGKARNTLWALQAMGAWHLRPTRRFQIDVIGKVLGGALNRDLSEKDTSIVTGGPTSNAKRERTDFGWGAEAEVKATWRPWARVGITASYTLLFLDDVSRGHEILDFSQAATGSLQITDAKDSMLVHSFFLGVHFDI